MASRTFAVQTPPQTHSDTIQLIKIIKRNDISYQEGRNDNSSDKINDIINNE